MRYLLIITTLVLGMSVVSCTSELDNMTEQGEEITENVIKLKQTVGLESEDHAILTVKYFADYHRLSITRAQHLDNGTVVYYLTKGVYSVYNISEHTLTHYRLK